MKSKKDSHSLPPLSMLILHNVEIIYMQHFICSTGQMPRGSVSSAGCIQVSVSTCFHLYTYSTVLLVHSRSHILLLELVYMVEHLFWLECQRALYSWVGLSHTYIGWQKT